MSPSNEPQICEFSESDSGEQTEQQAGLRCSRAERGGGEFRGAAKALDLEIQHAQEPDQSRHEAERNSDELVGHRHVGRNVAQGSVEQSGTDAAEEANGEAEEREDSGHEEDASEELQYQPNFGLLTHLNVMLCDCRTIGLAYLVERQSEKQYEHGTRHG